MSGWVYPLLVLVMIAVGGLAISWRHTNMRRSEDPMHRFQTEQALLRANQARVANKQLGGDEAGDTGELSQEDYGEDL